MTKREYLFGVGAVLFVLFPVVTAHPTLRTALLVGGETVAILALALSHWRHRT